MQDIFKTSRITIPVLFGTACNPIPPAPRIEPNSPFVIVGEQPLQAGLYDLAFALKQFEPGVTDIEFNACASLLLEIPACTMEQSPLEEEHLHYRTVGGDAVVPNDRTVE